MAEAHIDVAALTAFATEAAGYFESRPTGGEDAAHWSNVYNAENCRNIATALQSLSAELAEAKRNSDIAIRAAIDSGEALENAEEELATMREALEQAKLYVERDEEAHGRKFGTGNAIRRALGGTDAK